ncbi:MAG: tRNA A-37 threonylcarbamoyl transferase component Bud32 [Flavobacteriales bacterium]|jgi:tRNA A-37 threonylcarbamoyl transferase component Bud32
MDAMTLHLSKLWSYLSGKLRLISVRFLILLFALIFSYSLPEFRVIDRWDSLALRASLWINVETQAEAPRTALITIPDDEFNYWLRDVYAASNFSGLLANILESPSTTVGIVIPERVNVFPNALDNQVRQGTFSVGSEHDLFLKHKSYLADLLQDRRVVLSLMDGSNAGISPLQPKFHDDYFHRLREFFLQVFPCRDCSTTLTRNDKILKYYSVPSLLDPQVSLVSHQADGLYLNALGAMHWSTKGLTHQSPILQADYRSGLSSEGFALKLGDRLQAVPANYVSSAYAPKVSRLNLHEALVSSSFPKLVLLSTESDTESALKLASTLQNIDDQAYFIQPWWWDLSLRLAYIILALILCFVLTLIRRPRVYWSLIAAGTVVLVGIQFGGAIWANFYFPMASFLLFYLFFAILLSLWKVRKLRRGAKETLARKRITKAANKFEHDGEFRSALELLLLLPNVSYQQEKMFYLVDSIAAEEQGYRPAMDALTELRVNGLDKKRIDKRIKELKDKQEASLNETLVASTSRYDTPQNIPQNLGRYQLDRELGRGAVGIVYLGYDPAIARKVAIKTLNYHQFSQEQVDGLKARFFREAEAAGRLSHPNIVSVYDVGEGEDLAYIAMDYVDGEALSVRAVESALLPIVDVYRIIHDVALALDYAHAHQVIHRDIKPGNILYSASPYQVKVADFGIARLLDHSRTSTGEILGSPLYMAPEQLKGSKVDVEADIFSLGVTFYQLLVGHLPFSADNLAGLTYEIIHSKHKSVRHYRKELPASAVRIVNQCLQKDPSDRYESALELATVLKKALRRDFPNEAKAIGFA